jgi:hypothetical protein
MNQLFEGRRQFLCSFCTDDITTLKLKNKIKVKIEEIKFWKDHKMVNFVNFFYIFQRKITF